MKDVPLMKVDGNECLILGTLNLSQLFCRHFDEHVQDFLEVVVGRLHDLLVTAGMLESFCCFSRPDHLEAQKSNL